VGAQLSADAPNAAPPTVNDPPPIAESPEPAVVAIRSNPPGAMVIRNGEKLGETPISLLVRPSEPFVRVELRLTGYQPLAAELTAKDGERTFKLAKGVPPIKAPPRRPRLAQKPAPSAPEPEPAKSAPVRKTPHDPYERFE
jgi:hypothetical protein